MNNVKRYREAKHWSVYDLASRARVTPQGVYKLEAGKVKRPTQSMMGKLAMALGVSVAELFPNT